MSFESTEYGRCRIEPSISRWKQYVLLYASFQSSNFPLFEFDKAVSAVSPATALLSLRWYNNFNFLTGRQ